MRFGLKTKIAALSSILVIITTCSIAFYFYSKTKQDLLTLAYKDLDIDIKSKSSHIQSEFTHLKNNVRFFSNLPSVQGIIRSSKKGGVDPQSKTSLEEWKDRLSLLMYQLLKNNTNYLQARLIGLADGGKEIVRVDSPDSGIIRIVRDKELQSKGKRIYFQEILKTREGTIYFSTINLNREFGKITKPHIATVRAGTLVYDSEGNPFGFILINLNLTPLFNELRGKNYWIVNEKNQFLVHPEKSLEFNFERGESISLEQKYPLIRFKQSQTLDLSHLNIDLQHDSEQYKGSYTKIFYDSLRPDRYVGLIKLVKSSKVLLGPSKTLNHVLVFGICMILLAILLSWLISFYITQNIAQLVEATKQLGAGKDGIPLLPLRSKDETGVLAHAFKLMSSQLHDRLISLKNEKAQISTILDSMVDPQITINSDGLIQSINRATVKTFGYSAEEMVGENVSMLMPEPYHSEHDEYIKNYLETGIQKIIGIVREVEGLKKDGSVFPIELSIGACNMEGKQWFTGIIRDISQRKKIEQELSVTSGSFQTILDSMGEGLYKVDLEGRTTFINPRGLKILGYTEEEMIGAPQHSLIHHSYPDGTTYPRDRCPIYNAFRHGKEYHVDNEVFWHKDGSSIPVDYISRPVKENGEIIGAVITFRDNSEKMAINITLKDEQERNRLLKNMASTANAARNPDEALAAALEFVCEYTKWPVGHVYKVSTENENLLVPTKIWSIVDSFKFKSFIEATEQTSFRLGEGLPGRVLKAQSPAWIEDISKDSNFSRAGKTKVLNLKGAFAFPVFSDQKVVAVLEFFSQKKETPNPTLLSFLLDVGGQLGIVVERHLAAKELVESEQKIKGILDHTTAVIYIKDIEGKYLLVNREYEILFQLNSEDILGKTDFDIFPEKFAQQFKENDQKVLQEMRALNFEEEVIRDDKKETYLSIKFPMKDTSDNVYGICGISTDITERIIYEAKTLEAQQQAEEANKAKSSFLANMSHEIRTPMNAIMGMAHLALQTELNPKQTDYIQKILAGSKSLLTIINDILDFSKIEAGKLDIEEVDFDLEELLYRISTFESLVASKKGLEFMIQFDPDVPVKLLGDSVRLGQVLTNLINNAIKFTSKGEVLVQVSLKQKTEENILIEFSVKDTGVGLTDEQKDKLFKPFTQADLSTTRKFGGTGLGLSICQRLVKMMGGEIGVENKESQGSRFFFTALFGCSNVTKEQPTPPEELRDMPILILEPNPTNRQNFLGLLENFSFKPEAVDNRSSFLEKLTTSSTSFPLVIINWENSHYSPDDLVAEIYKRFPNKGAPKIIFTVPAGPEHMVGYFKNVCADGILTKPVFSWTLFNGIMEVFDKKNSVPSPEALEFDNFKLKDFSEDMKGKVLVVEDNEINQQVAREFLEGIKLNVTIAENGKLALDALERESFDLIFMDLQMPVMDGYQATLEIRRNPHLQSVPIIAMTASAMVGERDKVLKIGMNDYVSKPIDPPQLIQVLTKWLPGIPREKPSKNEIDQEINLQMGLEGLNLKSSIARLGGNKKLYIKLILQFADNNKNFISNLKKKIESENWEEMDFMVHKLKGTSGSIGATDVYRVCLALEEKISLKNISELSPLVSQLIDAFESVFKSISSLDRRENYRPPEQEKPFSPSSSELKRLQNQIVTLKNLLNEGNSEALQHIEPLRQVLENTSFHVAALEMQKEIQCYNFETGLEILDHIANEISKMGAGAKGE